MPLIIQSRNLEDISLETLQEIQKQSFDSVYLEGCSYLLEEDFKDSSHILASIGDKSVGYILFLKPRDGAYHKWMDEIKWAFEWREYIESGGEDLSELVDFCQKCSGLNIDSKKIKSFPVPDNSRKLLSIDLNKDVYLAEIAVHPLHRGKKICSSLISRLHQETNGKIYAHARDNTKMKDIFIHLGYIPLFQYGPLLRDGSSYILYGHSQ